MLSPDMEEHMIDQLRNYCEKHKILFGHVCVAIFFFVMYLLGKLFQDYYFEYNELVFWAIFFILFFPYLLFMKWFARIKNTD